MKKLLDRIFSIKKQSSIERNNQEILTKRYMHFFGSTTQQSKANERTLIIIPGYSVDNPPRIGHHLYHINALKFDPEKNPFGYKRIYLFDIYSQKDGRCNFKHSIPELAEELYTSIDTERDSWEFKQNGEIDIIGASMGGLIARKFIQEKLSGQNKINTKRWGTLRVRNILLIATPNKGCKIVDRLQSPLMQLLLRIIYGKDNFSKSEQFQQIRVGNQPICGKIMNLFIKRKTKKNEFLEQLNILPPTPGTIRWTTIRGTKRQWFTKSIFGKQLLNDGVVEAKDVILPGAENICDTDLGPRNLWNHRDLYVNEDVSSLMFGVLVLGLDLPKYLLLADSYNEKLKIHIPTRNEGARRKSFDTLLKEPISLMD